MLDGHPVEHDAQHVTVDRLQALEGEGELVALDQAGPGDNDRAVDELGDDDGIRDRERRGRVDDHVVEPRAEVAQETAHRGRPQQLGRVGRDRPGAEDPKVGAAVGLDDVHDVGAADECVGEADAALEAHVLQHLGAPQVGLDEAHPRPGLRHGERQVRRHGALALARERRGHDDGAGVGRSVDELQVRAQDPEGLGPR